MFMFDVCFRKPSTLPTTGHSSLVSVNLLVSSQAPVIRNGQKVNILVLAVLNGRV